MAGKNVIAICMSGGEFETNTDGQLNYKGGEAHAMEIDSKMKFKDFKVEVADMFNSNLVSMSIKYFLPENKKTLITISNDKDFKRMVKFYGDSGTADIYAMIEEIVAHDVSDKPGTRSSMTTLSEPDVHVTTEEIVAPDVSNRQSSRSSMTILSQAEVPIDVSPNMINNVLDDINEPGHVLDATFDLFGDIHHDEAQNGISTEIVVPTEMPIPVSIVGSYDEKHVKAAQQWDKTITGVGQRFNTVHEFREAVRKYAIVHRFAFKYKKNDSHRVTVKCKDDSCPWRIHASRLTTTPLMCIKKMNPEHTCEGSLITTGSGYKASRTWVASIIKDKLKVFPNYKPKDIVDDIKQEFGIQLNYYQAWRGKEIAMEQLQGSYKEAYGQLPYFCEKIMETNPGSLATFTTKEDSSFHRLFVSFHACLYGFEQGCRPLLFLDSTFLKSKYQGTLLAATAADGDDGFFPVAFAIVDRESNDNWHWFLEQLKTALLKFHELTIVADREKGLKESIDEIFRNEQVYHGFCMRYLSEQYIRDLKGQFSHEVKRLMVENFNGAAFAPTVEGFQRCVDRIKHSSIEAYNWVMKSDPVHWANALFPGSRYNHMTSNFGELFYGWVSDAHELPITQMVETIRGKINELIFSRRTESSQWLRRLTPSMEEKLEKETIKIRPLQVLISTSNRFEVRGDTIETVDVDNYDCTCKGWQLTGLPCCHGIAVIGCLGRDPYSYCSPYFTTENYKMTYSESVNPILSGDGLLPKVVNSQLALTVTPPATRRPPGRPTKKAPHEIRKRQPKCRRCKVIGHKKSNCTGLFVE